MRKLSARPNGDVHYVFDLTDDMLHDCVMIANTSRPADANAMCRTLSHEVNNLHHIMMVYQARGFIYGFIKGHIDRDAGHVDWLFVDPRCQRFGIGTRLLGEYEKWCRSYNDVKQICVHRSPTLQSKNFYAKMGYQQINQALKCCKDLGR